MSYSLQLVFRMSGAEGQDPAGTDPNVNALSNKFDRHEEFVW